MARLRTYECPSCTRHFQFMHHPSDEPPPRYCPLCGFDTETEPLAEPPPMPALRSRQTQGVDDLMRADEEGAAHRAVMAQEQFGSTTQEASSIALHNMRTDNRVGEDSVVPVNNSVTQIMANPGAAQAGMGFNAAAGLGYSQSVSTGPAPNAGARTMARVRQQHVKALAGSGHAGAVSSDLPALETQQPGYRRRV